MKKIFLFFTILFMTNLAFSAFQNTGNEVELRERIETSKNSNQNELCTADFKPVCGVDGKTYSNQCIAGDVRIAHTGECREKKAQCSSFQDESACLNNSCSPKYGLVESEVWYKPWTYFTKSEIKKVFISCENTHKETISQTRNQSFENTNQTLNNSNNSNNDIINTSFENSNQTLNNQSLEVNSTYNSASWNCGKIKTSMSGYEHTQEKWNEFAQSSCSAICNLGPHCEIWDFEVK